MLNMKKNMTKLNIVCLIIFVKKIATLFKYLHIITFKLYIYIFNNIRAIDYTINIFM